MIFDCEISYLVRNSLIGSITLKVPESVNKPNSIAFFCSTCGDVWGRAFVKESADAWLLYQRPCDRHQVKFPTDDSRQPPGSLAAYIPAVDMVGSPSWAGTFEAMPRSVKIREAKLRGINEGEFIPSGTIEASGGQTGLTQIGT